MKGAFISLLIAAAILVLLWMTNDVRFTTTSVDVHVHDTYLVCDYTFFIGAIVIFLGIFFSAGGLVSSSFRSMLFWAILLICVAVASVYLVNLFGVLN